MSNELSVQSESEIIETLKSSIYPDASDASIRMVLAYCKSLKVDPLSRVVHIVPMNGKDVLIQGITLHRVMAHRSGCYMGMSDPEFGPPVCGLVGKTKLTYPAWCKIVVRKLVNGQIAEFGSTEYWLENYAKINDRVSPNKIWFERPYGQLAKVCESQALRKAFPESISSAPSLEEIHHVEPIEASAALAVTQTADAIKAQFSKPELDCNVNFETGESLTYDGATVTKTGVTNYDPAKDNLLDELRSYINSHNLTVEKVAQLKARYAATSFTELRVDQLTDILDGLKEESK